MGGNMIDWVEALKYGPTSIAAIVAVRTAVLFQTELARDKVRPPARTLIALFMVFAIILTALSFAFAIYDHLQNSAEQAAAGQAAKVPALESKIKDLEDRLGRIREKASAMDLGLLNKRLAETQIANNEIKNTIKQNIEKICEDVGTIGRLTDDLSLGQRCREKSGVH